MKPKLTFEQLIKHMKAKGVNFNVASEEEALTFLQHNNYYLKLASYRTNYQKDADGKYVNLDFAYLKELSTLDMHVRYMVMQMCLDIEHFIKVRLMNLVTLDTDEDGYCIVRKFLDNGNSDILSAINKHKAGSYCEGLIENYYPDFPLWVFVELISFNNLINLCGFYEIETGKKMINNSLMNTIRDLRNAAAHSNCLLNKFTEKMAETKQPHYDITSFVKLMPEISKTARRKYLHYQFVYDFVSLLYVYNSFASEDAKAQKFKQLKNFMEDRAIRHREYFDKNTAISDSYRFLKKIIDNLARQYYTFGTIEK